MWVTLVNQSSVDQLKTYLGKSPKVQDKVIPVLVSNHTKEYEKSNENKCCSLKVLYENGLVAKRSINQCVETRGGMKLFPQCIATN